MTSLRFAAFLSITYAISSTAFAGAAEIPARPEFGVLDRAAILPLPVLKVTERMISEHERLTEEQLSIFTVSGVPSGSLSEFSAAVFDEWRKTAPRPLNAVFILVNGESGEVEIRTGPGLDPVLSSAKMEDIRNHIFKPEWSVGKKSRSLVLSFVEILRVLESPLVTSNEAIDSYERAGFSGGWTPAVPSEKSWVAWLLAALGVAVAAFVLVRIMIGEVHYTATGWFRVPAARNLKRLFRRAVKTPSLVTGGGVSGKY